MAAGKPKDEARPEDGVPPENPFAIGEHVTGQGVTGEVVERPGPYSVTVQPKIGPRITLSVTRVERLERAEPA